VISEKKKKQTVSEIMLRENDGARLYTRQEMENLIERGIIPDPDESPRQKATQWKEAKELDEKPEPDRELHLLEWLSMPLFTDSWKTFKVKSIWTNYKADILVQYRSGGITLKKPNFGEFTFDIGPKIATIHDTEWCSPRHGLHG